MASSAHSQSILKFLTSGVSANRYPEVLGQVREPIKKVIQIDFLNIVWTTT